MTGTAARLEQLFDRAIALPEPERAAFVRDVCTDDTSMEQELLSLLAFHRSESGFLDDSPLGEGVKLREFTSPEGALVGRKLGPYRLLSLLGSGGMSSVYLAERADGAYRQEVAVKVIKPGMDSEAVVRRFHAERQVLASLEHVHIARLLDGGTTDDGLPFLVMERIRGEPITDWCAEHRADIRKRLQLFLQVCSAVGWAHEQHVLHRDIKPSNILVTDDGACRLLDFGIAKILDTEDEGTLSLTTTTQRFYTPEYASPEQIRGAHATPATDVYSLGVVLYELVTGDRPLRLTRLSPQEVERVLCEQTPAAPSRQVLHSDHADPLTNVEGGAHRLQRRLSGDLDVITLMALRKEPTRRYASVDQLADDVRRHLDGLPIAARREALSYRASRFLWRHRYATALVSLLALLIVAATTFAVRDARRDRSQAAAQRILDFLQIRFDAQDGSALSRDAVRESLAQQGARDIVEDLADQPEEQVRFAAAVAGLCAGGHLDREEVEWRALLLEAQRRVPERSPRDEALAEQALAKALAHAGHPDDALDHLAAAAGFLPSLAPRERVEVLLDQAVQLRLKGRFDEARARVEQAMGETLGAGDELVDVRVATLLETGRAFEDAGDSVGAEREYRRALQAAESAPGAHGLLRAAADHALGRLLLATPGFVDAEFHLRRALVEMVEQLDDGDPRLADCRNDLAVVHQVTRSTHARFVDSLASRFWRRAHADRGRRFEADSLEIADSLETLVRLHWGIESVRFCRSTASILGRFLPPEHPRLARLAMRGATLGLAYGDSPGVTPTMMQVVDRAGRDLQAWLPSGHWRLAEFQDARCAMYMAEGRYGEALVCAEEQVRILEAALGDRHPFLAPALARLRRASGAEAPGEPDATFESADASRWPFRPLVGEGDLTAESEVTIDFEDDHLERDIDLPDGPAGAREARLWMYIRPSRFAWGEYRRSRDYRLHVNGDPAQVLTFDVTAVCDEVDTMLQWVPLEVPVSWLRAGRNRFVLSRRHDPGWEETQSWSWNNLVMGIDQGRDADMSWWIGSTGHACCRSMALALMSETKPIDRFGPLVTDHRELGRSECRGELMMYLELVE